jgi:phosphate-selective porin OprO/OprP
MKLKKLSLTMACLITSSISYEALALDLYVDTKTQQIFAEPGPGRTKLGSFERVEDNAAKTKVDSSQQAEINKLKDDVALENNAIKALDEHVNDPTLGKVRMGENGVKWESADGNFDLQLNGRIQLDSQVSMDQDTVRRNTGTNTTNALGDGTAIRRARLSTEGHMFKEFGYKFEYDFDRGSGSTAGGITEAWMNWNGYTPVTLTIGQFKEPMSIEEATSDIQTSFIERNMAVNAFIDNFNVFKMGIGLKYVQPRYTLQTAFQTESIGNGSSNFDATSTNTNFNSNRNNGSGDTGWGITGRATGLPWFVDKTHFFHFGGSGSQRFINVNSVANQTAFGGNGGGLSFGAALDTNVDRTNLLSTGAISTPNGRYTTQTMTRGAGETAFVYGPLSVQAEYLVAQVGGNGLSENTFNGYYGFASLFLTPGDSRNYNDKMGIFDRIRPQQNFSTTGGKGWGALEMIGGYDYLDLNSGIIHGGRAATGKMGLNWYPNSRWRIMANFIHVLELDTANTGSFCNGTNTCSQSNYAATGYRSQAFNHQHPDIFEMRTQIDF